MKKYLWIIFLSLIVNFGLISAANSKEKVYPKPVVVTFYEKSCDTCKEMDILKESAKDVFGDEVDFVDIDFSDDDPNITALKKRYNIQSAPTTLFLNAKYRITKKASGYIHPKAYLEKIEAIAEQ